MMDAAHGTADDDVEMGDMDVFSESVLDLLDNPIDANVSVSTNLRTDAKFNGFDTCMGKTWIYPTNYPVRQYQMNICRTALFKNTLVVLPTGLGKTFIASVVMYNLFRWYPRGRIIFMAPTRPLVNQQIDACYQIMGFPKDETVELTGKQNKKARAIAWKTKRVFYATPQVVWSDLNDAEMQFPIGDIKLVVVDEAHKAKGKYAYVEVVQSIASRNKMFRVLALSATPGKSLKDVAEVVQNLLISHIEVRRETSIDVVQYIHKKTTKPIIVRMDERLKRVRRQFFTVIESYVETLHGYGVISASAEGLSKQWLLHSFAEFKSGAAQNRHPNHSDISFNFSVCISMYHALELLEGHGLRVFLHYFNDESGSGADEKFFVAMDPKIRQFVEDVRNETNFVPFADNDMSFYGGDVPADDADNIDYGHPKFETLRECLVQHFQELSDTKAIVFCEFRESVYLINRMLLSERPLIKPKVFVGQGSKHSRTITQKEQIAIMNSFRSGAINTLIATCVAEEGIDVGEVDYIVCFDVNNKNPIRFVQRSGRTGRKRQGKITILATEGKEEQKMRGVLANKDGINQRIGKSAEVSSVLYREAPRLVPPEFNPNCVEMFIDIKAADPNDSAVTKPKKPAKAKKDAAKAKPAKKPSVRSRDMRNFFQPVELDNDDCDVFDVAETSKLSTSLGQTDGNTSVGLDHLDQLNASIIADTRDPSVDGDGSMSSIDCIPIQFKVDRVFQRYCDIMSRRMDVCSALSPATISSAIGVEQLPATLKQFYAKKRAQRGQLFGLHADRWPASTADNQQKLCQILGLLKCKRSQAPVSGSQDVDFGIVDASEEPLTRKTLCPATRQSLPPPMTIPVDAAGPVEFPPQAANVSLIATSTPNKLNITCRELPFDSPIVNCTMPRPVASPFEPPECAAAPKNYHQNYLAYLGLRTIDDLFSDDEECSTANRSPNCSKAVRQLQFADDGMVEESQCTVSTVLNVCAGDEPKAAAGSCATACERAPLNIGNVDNLFSDESDCTVDYDPAEVMPKLDETRVLPRPGPFGDARRTITRMKSDDLFSTFNESSAVNNSTGNAANGNASRIATKADRRERTPDPPPSPPPSTLNLAIYRCRSPSMLTRSSGVVSKHFSNALESHSSKLDASSLNDSLNRTASSTSDKNASILGEKLSILNTQLSISRHFDESDDSKENCPASFATCQSTASKPSTGQCDIDTDFEEDDIFAIVRTQSVHATPSTGHGRAAKAEASGAKRKKRRKPIRRNMFIDDEVAVSGDESDDDDSFIATQLQFTQTVDEDDPSVDMRAKYLQSIRSPVHQRHYRIPQVGYRAPQATQNIFSQFVQPDASRYEEDSFVVGSDEDDDDVDDEHDEDDESDGSDFNEITLVPVQKSRKRKSDEHGNCGKKKRRRIIVMSSDSE